MIKKILQWIGKLLAIVGSKENKMKYITLIRVSYHHDGTFGVLLDENVPFALTVEREWLNNVRDISCIPVGKYICRRVRSPKFGDTFEVTDVPDRTHILFHWGNIEDDTEGCIVVAEQFESLGEKVAVLSSKKGYSEFKKRTKDVDAFILEIKDA